MKQESGIKIILSIVANSVMACGCFIIWMLVCYGIGFIIRLPVTILQYLVQL